MARPKKQVEPVVENLEVNVVEEQTFAKPEPIIIIPEPIESLEVVMMKKRLLDEFEEAKALLKKKEEELALKEKELEQLTKKEIVESPTEEVLENSVDDDSTKEDILNFEVYEDGVLVDTVANNSEQLHNYLELNRKQLDEWIDELSQVPSDPNDLIFINFGNQQRIYRSYEQYFTQNGYAPKDPQIKSWMEYYKKIHNPITEEEIAVELKGKLRYSFNPIKS